MPYWSPLHCLQGHESTKLRICWFSLNSIWKSKIAWTDNLCHIGNYVWNQCYVLELFCGKHSHSYTWPWKCFAPDKHMPFHQQNTLKCCWSRTLSFYGIKFWSWDAWWNHTHQSMSAISWIFHHNLSPSLHFASPWERLTLHGHSLRWLTFYLGTNKWETDNCNQECRGSNRMNKACLSKYPSEIRTLWRTCLASFSVPSVSNQYNWRHTLSGLIQEKRKKNSLP